MAVSNWQHHHYEPARRKILIVGKLSAYGKMNKINERMGVNCVSD